LPPAIVVIGGAVLVLFVLSKSQPAPPPSQKLGQAADSAPKGWFSQILASSGQFLLAMSSASKGTERSPALVGLQPDQVMPGAAAPARVPSGLPVFVNPGSSLPPPSPTGGFPASAPPQALEASAAAIGGRIPTPAPANRPAVLYPPGEAPGVLPGMTATATQPSGGWTNVGLGVQPPSSYVIPRPSQAWVPASAPPPNPLQLPPVAGDVLPVPVKAP
jgi:hypothetical protein